MAPQVFSPRTHATNPFERWRKTHREATKKRQRYCSCSCSWCSYCLLPYTVVLYLFVVLVLISSIILVLLVLLTVCCYCCCRWLSPSSLVTVAGCRPEWRTSRNWLHWDQNPWHLGFLPTSQWVENCIGMLFEPKVMVYGHPNSYPFGTRKERSMYTYRKCKVLPLYLTWELVVFLLLIMVMVI